MTEISKKKKTFIKRNFKQLSLEELSLKTGLKHNLIRPLIEEYWAETHEENQSSHIENRTGIFFSWKTILVAFFIFAAVSFIIYSPSLHGDFVFDDKLPIQENPLIHITKISQLTNLFTFKDDSYTRTIDNRKICFTSFALNYYFGGLNTFGYHLVNVIIHILNGLVLFLLSYTILTLLLDQEKGRGNTFIISLLGSLLWLVHPIQTQAVSYIYQRLTSLAALFFILSLLCYIKGRLQYTYKRLVFFGLSILFGLFAFFTKQNTVTLPFFIILLEFLLFQHQSFKIDMKKLGFFLFLFGGFLIFLVGIYIDSSFFSRMAQCYQERGWTPLERVLTQLRVIIFYISLLIYPHPFRLNLDHDFALSHSLFSPFTTFLSLLVIVSMLGFAIYIMRRNRLVSFALLWFLGNLVIESSIIPLELVFEHRLYLPSMGLIMLVTALCFSLLKRKGGNWVVVLSILLILLFSYWTYERAAVWRGPFSLWMDAAKKSPHKARPHYNLGNAYREKSRFDEAISEYEQALTIKPNYSEAHNNLGSVYALKGRLDEAMVEIEQALAINPNNAQAYNNAGNVYLIKGEWDKAIFEYKQAIVIKPDNVKAYSNIGLVYYN